MKKLLVAILATAPLSVSAHSIHAEHIVSTDYSFLLLGVGAIVLAATVSLVKKAS
jgi:hypothetical protein